MVVGMIKDKIVYFGVIQYESNNAMCRHTKGITKLIEANGYRPITIGVSTHVRSRSYKKISSDLYVINDPRRIGDRIIQCFSSCEIIEIFNDIGVQTIKAFIMADFRFFPMKKMKKYCDKNGIYFIVNIMDKFQAYKDLISIIKQIDSNLRMRFFYPNIERKIYICSTYYQELGKGKHVDVIPGVTWEYSKKPHKNNEKIEMVFLGQPGKRCEKEKLDWIIKAVYGIETIHLTLAGFDKNEFMKYNRELEKYISENVTFLNRITNEECLELLKKSDFSLVIRPNSVLSQHGFSTKIGEAFSCRTLVIATRTSDNDKYIINGENGFICECNYNSFKQTIDIIKDLSKDDIIAMRNRAEVFQVLDYNKFSSKFKKVVIDK